MSSSSNPRSVPDQPSVMEDKLALLRQEKIAAAGKIQQDSAREDHSALSQECHFAATREEQFATATEDHFPATSEDRFSSTREDQLPITGQVQQPARRKHRPAAYTLQVTPQGIWNFKLYLRSMSIAFCLVLAGLGAKLVDVPGAIIILLVPAGLSFFWNLAAMICALLRKNRPDINPGARVGIDLIFWLGFGAAAVLMAAVWSTWGRNMSGRADASTLLAVIKAAVIFSIIEAVIHIALFVVACYETHLRNRTNKMIRHAAK